MPEAQTQLGRNPATLSPAEIDALSKIRWAREVPHPDGGTSPQFGLYRISIPRPGGIEFIDLRDGSPKMEFVERIASGVQGPVDRHSRLIFRSLNLHRPISVYLASPNGIVEPINPDQINEIGEFVIEADQTFRQDHESRLVLEGYKNIASLYQGYVSSGILQEDSELARKLAEEASVHINLLEETRKVLPQQVRNLVPKAEQLGILFIDERSQSSTSKNHLVLDPKAIKAVYTPDTDLMTYPEFITHSREVIRDMKPTDL